MPNIELSKNYEIIRSERGLLIMERLVSLAKDESFWRDSSIDEIVNKIIEILNTRKDLSFQPRYCTNHTHRKAEAYLINDILYSMRIYYHSVKVLEVFKRIDVEKPRCFVVRGFKEEELYSHLIESKKSAWW